MAEMHIFTVLALCYVAFGVGMITHPKTAKRLVTNLDHEPIALYIGGVMAVIMGYILVAWHQSTSAGWDYVFLLCLGYGALLKGLFILMLPECTIRYSQKMMGSDFGAQFCGLFVLALGLICGLIAFSL